MGKRRSLWDREENSYHRRQDESEKGTLICEEIRGVFRIDPMKNPFAPIWETEGFIGPVNATLSVYYERGSSEEIDVITDYCGETNFYVPVGNTRSRTFENLCRVALEAKDWGRAVKESGSVHYKPCENEPIVSVGKYTLKIYYYLINKGCCR